MNTVWRIALVSGFVAVATSFASAQTHDHAAAGALLYMDDAQWRQASEAQKAALSQDAMRIYCGDPVMPPASLVRCLDASSAGASLAERTLLCLANPRSSPP